MAFVSGPRQCGKTTLGKQLLRKRRRGVYRNWDDIEFRRLWTKSPKSVLPSGSGDPPLVVLDEIHKARSWKRTLKGIYDTREQPADILVTGSARLNVYRKGSDSLLGRYYHFRLHPFSLREMTTAAVSSPDEALGALYSRSFASRRARQGLFESLMAYGAFPEPLLAQDERTARLWRTSRVEAVIREDLRDLTRIPELSRIEMLASLLPAKVGSLLSIASLREDLEVSFDTAKRWLSSLQELYYVFEIKPYRRKIARSLRKAGKLFMWDYSEVPDRVARFENLVASHLLKACHYWTDTGEGTFELQYLRDKDKREIDFLIVRDKTPWLPVEVKLEDRQPSPSWQTFLAQLPCRRALQLVATPGVWNISKHDDGHELLVASAGEALYYFA